MLSPVKIWRNQKKIVNLLGLKGEIISYTEIYVPPLGFESQAPYVVTIVKLDNGRKYTAQLVDTFDGAKLCPLGQSKHAPLSINPEQTPAFKPESRRIDWEEKNLRIGQKIKTVLRRTRDPGGEGVIPYGIKFKPIN